MEIRAFGERTLARPVELPEKKKGILVMPDQKKEYQVCQVVDSSELSEGMYIFTRNYAGLPIKFDDVDYLSFDSKEILAYSKELK